MTSRCGLFRVIGLLYALLLPGCALPPIDLSPAPRPDFPEPRVSRSSLTIAVYYSPEFSGARLNDTFQGITFIHQPGSANTALFDRVLESSFRRVIRLHEPPAKGRIPAEVDAIFVPRLVRFSSHSSTPIPADGITRTAQFEIQVLTPELEEIDAWEVTASSPKPDGLGWQHDRFYSLVYRNAAAQLLRDFTTRGKLVARLQRQDRQVALSTDTQLAGRAVSIMYPGARSIENDATESNFVSCLAEPLSTSLPQATMVPPRSLRDALFPWLDPVVIPKDRESMSILLARPAIREASMAAGIRFLILMDANTHNADRGPGLAFCGLGGCLGGASNARTTRVRADVWDLSAANHLGTLEATEEGRITWIMLLVPVPIISPTEGNACRKAADSLRPLLDRN